MSTDWIDFSYARPDYSAYAGVLRYLETGSTRPDLTVEEANTILQSGKPISLICQFGKSVAGGGYDLGVTHAKAANAEADRLGAPQSVVIWYTVDAEALTPEIIAPYFEGVRSVPGRPVGIYGSYKIVEWAHSVGINYCWQTKAWSGGLISSHANIYQYDFSDPSRDLSRFYSPFPAWEPNMGVRIYPKANTTAQWFEPLFDRKIFTQLDKFLLHTTETTGWPAYSKVTKGDSAPNITYHPKYRTFRQHNYANTSARALVDPDGTPVRENRDNVFQIEIIAYADFIKADTVGGLHVNNLSEENLQDLADLYKWLHNEWGCPIQTTLEFPPYRPYKNVRLTSAEYDAYRGMLGHMHASGNTHTDPGNINAQRIVQLAQGTTIEDDMFTDADRAKLDSLYTNRQVAPWQYKPADRDAYNFLTTTDANVKSIAASVAALASVADVDENAIVQALLPALTGNLVAALTETLANLPSANATEIAEATLNLLHAKITPTPSGT